MNVSFANGSRPYSVLRLDLRTIARDHVALGTVLLSVLGTAAVTILGAFQARLPGWSDWFPLMIAVSLAGGPAAFGFLFGALMVDEGDTGVRRALSVTPLRPSVLLLVRTGAAAVWMVCWPLASVYLMNSTWQAVDLAFVQWLVVTAPLGLFTAAFALVVPTLAEGKVSALAVLKGLSFLSLVPVALLFLPPGAWSRPLFLVSPTGWVIEAFEAFLERDPHGGYGRALGGILYGTLLLGFVVSRFRRKVYALGR